MKPAYNRSKIMPTPYNIPTGSDPAFAAGCVAYYGDAGRYYGD